MILNGLASAVGGGFPFTSVRFGPGIEPTNVF
jgi:hypothetical protein